MAEKHSGTQRTEHSWGESWRAGTRAGMGEAERQPGKMRWVGWAGTNDGDAPKLPFSQLGDGQNHGDRPPGVASSLATPLSPGWK